MEFNFSIRKSIKKHISTSSHVRSNNFSARVLSEIYDFLHFRNDDFGNTKKYINAYSRNGLVYMVVNKLASGAASLPREYHNVKGEIIENSEIEKLMKKPNSFQSETEFRQTLNEYLALSGNAFILNLKGIGAGNEIEVLDSANMKININSIGDAVSYQYTDNVGKRITYDTEEILHIRFSNSLNVDREQKYWGLSPLKSLWLVVDASNNLFTALSALWKNKGIIGIITNKSGIPLLPKERQELQDKFQEDVGGPLKANQMHVTSGDLSFIQTGMSPADLKLLEGNLSNLRLISAGYELPSVLFNDMASSTYNNMLEAKRAAFTDAYIPLDEKVNEKLSAWLSGSLGVEEVIVVDTTRIEVLKLTTNEVSNKLNNLPTNVAARVMEAITVDEARDLIGLDIAADGGKILLGKSNNKPDENKEIE